MSEIKKEKIGRVWFHGKEQSDLMNWRSIKIDAENIELYTFSKEIVTFKSSDMEGMEIHFSGVKYPRDRSCHFGNDRKKNADGETIVPNLIWRIIDRRNNCDTIKVPIIVIDRNGEAEHRSRDGFTPVEKYTSLKPINGEIGCIINGKYPNEVIVERIFMYAEEVA